jgi:hypothetical protein
MKPESGWHANRAAWAMSWMLVRTAAVTAPAATGTGDEGHLALESGGLGMIMGAVVWFT